MNFTSILPLAGAAIAAVYLLWTSLSKRAAATKPYWAVLLVFAAFLVLSGYAVFLEGPFGFWDEHTRNAWGNQIWFDLIIGISIAWFFILPRARQAGMKLPIWASLVLATGCIGLSLMVARLLYLEGKPR